MYDYSGAVQVAFRQPLRQSPKPEMLKQQQIDFSRDCCKKKGGAILLSLSKYFYPFSVVFIV
jgi:hypothetical protein